MVVRFHPPLPKGANYDTRFAAVCCISRVCPRGRAGLLGHQLEHQLSPPALGLEMMLQLLLALALMVPNPKWTPGALATPARDVCAVKWGLDRRFVTIRMKKQVAAWYGVAWKDHGKYEFDHAIPRALGGADAVTNLWPQPWVGKWNAHQKDVLENTLHRMVCAGTIPLDHAQWLMVNDWTLAYQAYVTR